ncbi:MAG: hypothetical protein M1541_10560 [Acidobacteria bacterium]|nr:hypothetical protein [Acidobacteriota bacterium]
MDTAKVKEYVCLCNRVADLKAELKQAEHDKKQLEVIVVDEMCNAGFKKVEADGRVLTLKRKVEASPLNGRHDLTDALKDAGLDELISYSDPTIRAYVKEVAGAVLDHAESEQRDPSEEEVRAAFPEAVGRALKFFLGFELSNRKA